MYSKKENKTTSDILKTEIDSRNFKFVRALLYLSIILFSLLFIFSAIINHTLLQYDLYIYIGLVMICIFLIYILNKGYLKTSANILIFILWVGLELLMWQGNGIYDAANQATIILVLFSALIINRWVSIFIVSVSIINFWIAAYYIIDLPVLPNQSAPLNMARYYTFIMIGAITLAILYERAMHNSIQRIGGLVAQTRIDQKKIKDTERNYHEIFEAIEDAIFIHDSSNGRIVDFNMSASNMFGYQKKEFINLTIEALSNVEEGYNEIKANEAFKKTNKEGQKTFEWSSKRANGSIFPTEITLKIAIIGGHKRVIAVVRDISKQKIDSEKIIASEEKYRKLNVLQSAILENAGYAVIATNTDGIIHTFNKAAEQMLGYKANEMIYQKSPAIFHDVNEIIQQAETLSNRLNTKVEANFDAFIAEARTGNPKEYEWTYIRKDKTRIPVLLKVTSITDGLGMIIGYLGVAIDISEKKQNQKELLDREKKYRTLFEGSVDAIVIIENGVFVDCNHKAQEIFGCTRDQIINSTPQNFSPMLQPDGMYSAALISSFLSKANIGESQFFEWLHCRFSKDTFFAEVSLNRIDLKGKKYIQAIIRDISIRKNIENNLKESENKIRLLNESLEQKVTERTQQLAQVNSDLESFAYSISHDLRAPLRHIESYTNLLYSNIEAPNPKFTSIYEKVISSTKRMTSMIDDLLTFSRLGRKELICTNFDLNKMIEEIIEQFRPDFVSRKIEWKISQIPDIYADPNLIRMVISNLISNAVKYTSQKEIALIEIGAIPYEKEWIEVKVKDNGAGFDMAYLNKLYGVFQRLHTEKEFAGTGIGLANVKQIISKHGGTVRAIGEVDNGASFFFTIKRAQQSTFN